MRLPPLSMQYFTVRSMAVRRYRPRFSSLPIRPPTEYLRRAVEVFEPQYAAGIESLLPSTMLRSQLYAAGKLPQYALFSLTPPAAEFADITPPTAPANLAAVFALGFGNAI